MPLTCFFSADSSEPEPMIVNVKVQLLNNSAYFSSAFIIILTRLNGTKRPKMTKFICRL